MKSSLMKCHVRHSRLIPKKYQFDISYFWFSINLNELDQLKKFMFLGINKFNIFQFNENDYLPGKDGTLKDRVIAYLKDNGVTEKVLDINLVTSVRVLGYVFNPVSYYFIKTEESNLAIIEIGNTFKEIKPYFVSSEHIDEYKVDFTTKKEFYISPFASMQNIMNFKIEHDEENISIIIKDERKTGELELVTTMRGKKIELSDKKLLFYFFRHPLMTLQVIFFIHIHALILFLKRIPYYKKSDESEYQRGYYSWK
jgi:DUF1365 family protein